jgi:hypothetical protein
MADYYYPDPSDPSIGDMRIFTTFIHAPYSTWATYRRPSSIYARRTNAIILPYPNNFNTLNNILYTNSPSIQIRAVEEVMRAGTGMPLSMQEKMKEGNANGFGPPGNPGIPTPAPGAVSALGRLAGHHATAGGELLESFLTGGNVFRADHTETVLKPGCRRTHVFEYTFIAKTEASALAASKIALLFQGKAHPGAYTKSIYTMNHPDIWIFGISDTPFKSTNWWDGYGLTSVLSRVDINRSPIQNIPYYIKTGTSGIVPLAINIKLTFIELEPAFNFNDWGLQVRSQKDV